MTGLEKWKEDKVAEIEKMNVIEASEEILMWVGSCKYCKYHRNKECLKGQNVTNAECLEGITEYLEGEV